MNLALTLLFLFGLLVFTLGLCLYKMLPEEHDDYDDDEFAD